MSKCYVIKNKLDENFELNCCTIYPTKQDAELTISLHQLKNCEVVECTICEGDIEKELAIRDKALRKCFTCGVGFIDGMYERALQDAREEIEGETKDV